MKLGPGQQRWAARVASWVIRFLGRAVRWRTEVPVATARLLAEERPVILAFWHGRLLMIPVAYLRAGRRRVNVLISEHGDGELISRTIAHFGFGSVRGSSRRGALKAMRDLIRKVQEGADFAFTPDGPRGPAHQVQSGVIDLARRTGYPILPVTYSVRRGKVFSSWDGFLLPRPFTRGVFCWGEPHWVDAGDDSERARADLETAMQQLTRHADELAGRTA
ncbi:lysophospholipid acyltransferase family protein [Thiohalorhabdus methylotrophus]|uniref:Lysophospholipid acyltransferase family protein n=1 Tax=Thiohalorhabdus methylotrophus TaxID=3242694 RepID=A0ABV4TW42_9GAMM